MGAAVRLLHRRGSQSRLLGLKFPVYLSWYYFKREDGKLEKRYVLCTKALKGSTIAWWGRRRWAIEGFFKTVKHPIGFTPFWSANPIGCVQMVSSLPNRLPSSSLDSSPFKRGS